MPPVTKESRSYAAAHFALELTGMENLGVLRSIEGGGLKADVMTYQNGGIYDRWRQVGKPKFEDIKLQIGMAMSEPFYKWIEQFFSGNAVRKSGAIVAGDFYYKERARREFTDAMITEIVFPKLDGQDKSTAYMNVSFAVENIQFKKGDEGKSLNQNAGTETQKAWKACNFRFSLEGFTEPCKRTTKIDSFTVKQTPVEYHSGGQWAPAKTPSPIDFPQISFYLPESDAQPLSEYLAAKFKKAEDGAPARAPSPLHGQLEAFDNAQTTKFILEFTGADIVNIQPDKSDSSTEEIKMVKVDLYVEKMAFTYKSG